jgi:hypothetical protein
LRRQGAARTTSRHASATDAEWLAATLSKISRGFGSRIERQPGGRLILRL